MNVWLSALFSSQSLSSRPLSLSYAIWYPFSACPGIFDYPFNLEAVPETLLVVGSLEFQAYSFGEKLWEKPTIQRIPTCFILNSTKRHCFKEREKKNNKKQKNDSETNSQRAWLQMKCCLEWNSKRSRISYYYYFVGENINVSLPLLYIFGLFFFFFTFFNSASTVCFSLFLFQVPTQILM